MRSHYMWFQGGKIDFDNLIDELIRILLNFSVCSQEFCIFSCQVGDFFSLGRLQIASHPFVERKYRGGGTEFGTHIGDGTFSCAAYRLASRSEILDDGAGSTF